MTLNPFLRRHAVTLLEVATLGLWFSVLVLAIWRGDAFEAGLAGVAFGIFLASCVQRQARRNG